MKKHKMTLIIFYIVAAVLDISAIIAFANSEHIGIGSALLCFGSVFLCLGTRFSYKNSDSDNDEKK